MLEVALKLLKEFANHSYKAYIVGGFVRDYLLGIESNDIDIATDATPKEIKEIFADSCLPNEDYGSVTIIFSGVRFEITTFRKEITYVFNRKPIEIQYISDLKEDLLRRDFTINTICMDIEGKIVDYLNGQEDLEKRIIRTVGNSDEKFFEDSLRILRAVRFATILDFSLCDEVREAIIKNKHLLKGLSYYRKKMELDKIFTSPNYKNGIKLLIELGLDKELEISNLEKVLDSDTISLIGIWSMLEYPDKYPFQKNETELISNVRRTIPLNNLDPMTLYRYGLYVNSVAGEIKKQDIRIITEAYNNLPIKGRNEIQITTQKIMNLLRRKPGKYLTDIYDEIEREILYKRLDNNEDAISTYIVSKFGKGDVL